MTTGAGVARAAVWLAAGARFAVWQLAAGAGLAGAAVRRWLATGTELARPAVWGRTTRSEVAGRAVGWLGTRDEPAGSTLG
ncbi:hypothetical protein ACFWM1_08865 [Nocardia sp. NPDC058379]|uniref:hypothetical protein n=1 Tax=Nocardia sp. NPDC058379 TaxID=3346470 RepID=UPI003654A4A2